MNGSDPAQPLASPVFTDLTGLPQLLCIVGGDETLLDNSARLVRNARIAGVNATLCIAAGMQHVSLSGPASSLKRTQLSP